jgi:hypothetical protein
MKLPNISLIAVFFITLSCKKNRDNPVPQVYLDTTININLPNYSALTSVGGWAYLVGGSKGIVIYRRSITEFVAFDRHSPADNGNCAEPLIINPDNFLQLDDLCSGATFSLYDGSPLSGSDFGLRAYITFYDGGDNLRVYN